MWPLLCHQVAPLSSLPHISATELRGPLPWRRPTRRLAGLSHGSFELPIPYEATFIRSHRSARAEPRRGGAVLRTVIASAWLSDILRDTARNCLRRGSGASETRVHWIDRR